MKWYCTWILVGIAIGPLSWATISAQAQFALSAESRLWEHLMSTTGYNKKHRPVLDTNTQTEVIVGFTLSRIESLDEKLQVMTTFGWLNLFWKDELLTWDPAAFDGLDRIVVPGGEIWLPEVAMLNSVKEGNDLSAVSQFRASIFSDGRVSWSPGFRWETNCNVQLKAFPYDTQECSVIFVNWVYQGKDLNYSLLRDTVSQPWPVYNAEWELVRTETSQNEYSFHPVYFDYIVTAEFTLFLKRRPAFYVINVIVPCILMSLVSALVFCLPAESGEKIGMGITVLLSYSVLLLMMSDVTPRSSSLPLITMYIVSNMGLTSLSLIGSVIVLNVYHHDPRRPVPGWIKTIFFSCFSRCLCMVQNGESPNGANEVPWPQSANIPNSPETEKDLYICAQHGTRSLQNNQVKSSGSEVKLPWEILAFIKNANQREMRNDINGENRGDWQRLAAVLDRLFFIIICIIIVAGAIGTMAVLKRGIL